MNAPAESAAFGPHRAPTCAPTTVPGTAVLAFQRVASAHQAEAYCQACKSSHDAGVTLACCGEAEDPEPVVHCPRCGEANSLVLIDAFTAGAVVQIHAALGAENRAKLEAFDAVLIATVCMKLATKGK